VRQPGIVRANALQRYARSGPEECPHAHIAVMKGGVPISRHATSGLRAYFKAHASRRFRREPDLCHLGISGLFPGPWQRTRRRRRIVNTLDRVAKKAAWEIVKRLPSIAVVPLLSNRVAHEVREDHE